MKKVIFLFISALFSIIAFSCGNLSPSGAPQTSERDLEAYSKSLLGYTWLNDIENYSNETYKDSIYFYFNQSLKDKNYDDATIYLLLYSKVLENKFELDSIYFNNCRNFYNSHKKDINGESQTNLCYYLGIQSHQNQDLIQSSEWFEKAINIPTETKSHKQIQGFSNFALAQNYSLLRDFESAEKHLVAALNIFVDVEDIRNQGTVYMLMHNIYMQKSAYKEAEATLEKALHIVKTQNSEFHTFSAYGFYVHLNVAKTDTLSAIRYIDSLANFAKTYINIGPYHKAILNQLLAFKHIVQKEENEALEFLRISREITDQTQNPDLKMRTLFQEIVYAAVFDKPLKNPLEVEEFYNEIAEAEEPNRQFMVQLGSALFNYYNKNGDYKKANSYVSFLLEDKDKALEESIKGKLFELERKFETEKKEKTILLQEKLLESQKGMIMSLGGSALLLAMVFLLFIAWNKNKSISRKKLLTESFTSQLLSKTEDERKRIASDLHDSVSNELVNLRHALEKNSFRFKEKIDTILDEVRNISRNLSPTLFDKLGLKQSIEQLTDRAQNQHSFLLSSEIDYSQSLTPTVELQLYRIIQEATTNIMKHANALAGKITITEDDKSVHVEIKDNGKGFEVDKMLEKGNCFGLLNITERTKYIQGIVNFKSDKNGTIINLSVPKEN